MYCDIHGVFILYLFSHFVQYKLQIKRHCGLDSIDSVNSTIVKVQNQESVFYDFPMPNHLKTRYPTQLDDTHTHSRIHSFSSQTVYKRQRHT